MKTNFRTPVHNIVFQLNQLVKDIEDMKKEYHKADDIRIVPGTEIEVGSRVKIISFDDGHVHGRVERIDEDTLYVKRDGHGGTMKFGCADVVNLSVTEKGRLGVLISRKEYVVEKLKRELATLSYDFIDFDLEPTFDPLKTEVDIQIIDLKHSKRYGLTRIHFTKLGNNEVKSGVVNTQIIGDVKPGKYRFTFMVGMLINIRKL